MRDPKTPEQLERELRYYRRELERTKSPDRIARITRAISKRTDQLEVAKQVRRR